MPVNKDPLSKHIVVKVLIECYDLPPSDWAGCTAISLGIQMGKQVVQIVQLPCAEPVFEAELRVALDPTGSSPNFLGPFAFGTPKDRFLYLCWGRTNQGAWNGFRRAKLPLNGLTLDDLDSPTIRGRLKCTDARGGPICATVKSSHFAWITGHE